MKTSYLLTVGGVLLTALPLLALLNGCGGGGGGSNGPRPTATPTFGPTPTTASSPIPTTTADPDPTATSTPTATATATSTPAPTSTPRPTSTPTPPPNPPANNVFNFTVVPGSGSNYGNIFAQAIKGVGSGRISATNITFLNTYTLRPGYRYAIEFTLSANNQIKVGDVFTGIDPNFKATIRSEYFQRGGPSVGNARVYSWNNSSDAIGRIIVQAVNGNSATLELQNVVLSATGTSATGSVTFNGTVTTTITG